MTPFRDATAQLSADVAVLAARRRAEAAAIPRGLDSVFVRRTARIAFGATGAVSSAVIAVVMMLDTGGQLAMLAATWVAAVIAYGIALGLASLSLRRALTRAVTPTGEPHHDLALLRAVSPRRLALDLDRRRVLASYRWPLVAAALLGPHTLHALVPVIGGWSFNGFDEWMQLSALVSVHVFAYAVWAAWRFPVRRCVRTDVFAATGLSIIPGVLTGGISVAITFFTAIAVAVAACWPMGRIIDRERAHLVTLETALLADEAAAA